MSLYTLLAPKIDPTPEGLDQHELLKRNYMKTYIESCKMLGVHPVQPIAASLADTHIVLKTRGLGVNGARAIAIALVVSGSSCMDLCIYIVGPLLYSKQCAEDFNRIRGTVHGLNRASISCLSL